MSLPSKAWIAKEYAGVPRRGRKRTANPADGHPQRPGAHVASRRVYRPTPETAAPSCHGEAQATARRDRGADVHDAAPALIAALAVALCVALVLAPIMPLVVALVAVRTKLPHRPTPAPAPAASPACAGPAAAVAAAAATDFLATSVPAPRPVTNAAAAQPLRPAPANETPGGGFASSARRNLFR